MCPNLTDQCPYKCGQSREEASFRILEYTKHTQQDPTATTKRESISFSVSVLPKQLRDTITLEDKVQLHWVEEELPKELQGSFASAFVTSNKKITKIECAEECGLGERSRCYTCNPQDATLDTLPLAGGITGKEIPPNFQLKMKITGVYADTEAELLSKEEFEKLSINKSTFRFRSQLRTQLRGKLSNNCSEDLPTSNEQIALEFQIIEQKIKTITAISNSSAATKLQECLSEHTTALKLRAPRDLKVRVGISAF